MLTKSHTTTARPSCKSFCTALTLCFRFCCLLASLYPQNAPKNKRRGRRLPPCRARANPAHLPFAPASPTWRRPYARLFVTPSFPSTQPCEGFSTDLLRYLFQNAKQMALLGHFCALAQKFSCFCPMACHNDFILFEHLHNFSERFEGCHMETSKTAYKILGCTLAFAFMYFTLCELPLLLSL